MADVPNWWMKGDWFDVCSCNVPCPCGFAQAPTNCSTATVHRERGALNAEYAARGVELHRILRTGVGTSLSA